MTQASLQQRDDKYNGAPYVAVTDAQSGATAEVALHGGQLLRWNTGGDKKGGGGGHDVMYLSPNTKVGIHGKAARGGVPICWPQFSDFGRLATSHGFARLLTWSHVPDPHHAVVELTSDSVRKQLAQLNSKMAVPDGVAFRVVLKTSIILPSSSSSSAADSSSSSSGTLEMTLTVENSEHSTEPMPFTTCLHSYFAVSSVDNIRLGGAYEPLPFLDTAAKRAKCDPDNLHEISGEVDRIYIGGGKSADSGTPSAIIDDAGRNTQLQIFFKNINDVVVWNPGPAKTFADMPLEDFKKFVCIEGSVIDPRVTLAPGEKWSGGQVLKFGPRESSRL